MYGIAEFLWSAVLGKRSAAWLFQASDEQRRNALPPEGLPSNAVPASLCSLLRE